MRPRTEDVDKIEKASSSSSSSSSSSGSDAEAKTTVIQKRVRRHSTLKEDSSGDESDIEFLYEQNFYEVREECLKAGRLFEDPEFPPDNDLLRSR